MELSSDKELQVLGQKASRSLAIDDWIQESLQLAGTEVYDFTVRDYVQSREQGGSFGRVSLPESYLRNGSVVCARRAVESGYRLAEVVAGLNKTTDEWTATGISGDPLGKN